MSAVARSSFRSESRPRAIARRLLAGRGRYTDDLRFPRLAHAAFLRSPHAHARIDSIDLAQARNQPGVIGVFDAQALACRPWQTRLATFPQHRSMPQGALAADRACWQGQPVAIVIAETRTLAEDALGTIEVGWTPLPAAIDSPAALAGDAPLAQPPLASNLAFEHRIEVGEPGLANAGRVIRARFEFSRHTGVPLEARTIVAEFDPTLGRLTVHQATQVPHQMRAVLAECLGLAEQDVRVHTPDVGGAFGIKLHVYDDEMAVCAAAMLVRRPVKFVCDRMEAFASDVHARAHRVDAAMALDAGGRILGFEIDSIAEAGAHSVYPRSSILEGMQAVGFAGIPYATVTHGARLRVAYLNKVGTGSYRGVGQPVGTGIVEALVDRGARALGEDPAAFRRRNFRTPERGGTRTPTGIETGALSHEQCLDRLLALMDYSRLRAMQASERARGRHLGIGLAAFVEQNAPGAAFYGMAGVGISAQDGCVLRLEPSGSITCVTSNADQGQGVETAIAQLVAATLDVPFSDVRVIAGDTAFTAVGGGAFASRGLVIAGEAAVAAARALRTRILEVGAALGLRPDDPALVREVGAVLNYQQHRLPPGVPAEPMVTAHYFNPQPFHLANGVQASLIELDIETGWVKLLKHWIVEDCGRVINPLLADEQLRGGIVQGIGAALWEECRYDAAGNLVTTTLADYLVPMARELPDIEIAHVETPVPNSLTGAKGIGEAGTIGAAAAVGNAINDALAPFGAVVDQQPYTPERILRALGKVEGATE